MRNKGVWGVLCLLLAVGTAAAQDGKVIFPSAEVTIGQVIETIEKQTDYRFSYRNGLFDTQATVSLGAAELPLRDALGRLASAAGVDYTVKNMHIVLRAVAQAPRREARPRTEDIYRKTPADSLGASSLRRPTDPTPGTPAARVHPISNLPTQPGLSAFSSAYEPVYAFNSMQEKLPLVAVRMNLLYAGATLTPNLALEVGTGPRTSVELRGSYNPWNRIGTPENNDKLVHWVVRPGFRYWFCERYMGHFVGVDAFYSKYNISGHKIPLVGFDKEFRYAGNAIGAGVNYGYHLPLGKQWGLEFGVGVGVARLKYDKFPCTLCSGVIETKSKTYFGPTSASVNLVFIIK